MSSFKLMGSGLLAEPRQCTWQFKVIGHDGNGLPILSPYAKVRLTRAWMTNAQWLEWYIKSPQHGYTTAVTITVPRPDTEVFLQYTGCYIESVSGNRVDDDYVRNVVIVIGKVAY